MTYQIKGPPTETEGQIKELYEKLAPASIDVKVAEAFLRKLHPGGPWIIGTFDPHPRFTCLEGLGGLHNHLTPDVDWYVHIGVFKTPEGKRAKKTDIKGSRWAWVDIDPVGDQTADFLEERLLEQENPHLIVRSGRGIWGLSTPEQKSTSWPEQKSTTGRSWLWSLG